MSLASFLAGSLVKGGVKVGGFILKHAAKPLLQYVGAPLVAANLPMAAYKGIQAHVQNEAKIPSSARQQLKSEIRTKIEPGLKGFMQGSAVARSSRSAISVGNNMDVMKITGKHHAEWNAKYGYSRLGVVGKFASSLFDLNPLT